MRRMFARDIAAFLKLTPIPKEVDLGRVGQHAWNVSSTRTLVDSGSLTVVYHVCCILLERAMSAEWLRLQTESN